MTDVLAIRAAADELLSAHEAMSATAIAEACGCTVRSVIGALTVNDRFERIAGEGCWWWRISPLAAYGIRKRRRKPTEAEQAMEDGSVARAHRAAMAKRERIRGALRTHGGMTARRIVEVVGLGVDEVTDLFEGLRALGEVCTFTLPGIPDIRFWKETAA